MVDVVRVLFQRCTAYISLLPAHFKSRLSLDGFNPVDTHFPVPTSDLFFDGRRTCTPPCLPAVVSSLHLAAWNSSQVMMMSVVKRASMPVTFWLLENFLSSSFKDSAQALADEFG